MKHPIIPLFIASCIPAGAIEIEIDYTYDTNGFFNQPGAKACLRAVADYYEGIIHDSLDRIDHTQWPAGNTWNVTFNHPATGASTTIPNLVVPANTLIIFAGSRPLGGIAGRGGPGGYSASGTTPQWLNLLASRGEAGALATPKTDFAPWGGVITFEPGPPDPWGFSISGPEEGTIPFVSIALHEFGHVLGIGGAPSWQAKISGGAFTGSRSMAAFGGSVPMSGTSHWRDDAAPCGFDNGYDPNEPTNVLSDAFGSFGSVHGLDQIALMDPSVCTSGVFHKVMTDLDLAALADIGWELIPKLKWESAQYNPAAGPVAFSWNTTTGFTYRVEISTGLSLWSTLTTYAGNGDPKSYSHTSPPPGKAFYRLNTNPPVNPAMMLQRNVSNPAETVPAPDRVEPFMTEDCRMGTSWGTK